MWSLFLLALLDHLRPLLVLVVSAMLWMFIIWITPYVFDWFFSLP
jgi:hypothetical protein